MRAELPEDFRPSICAVVNNDSELRKFLMQTEQMNKESLRSQKNNRLNTVSSGDLSRHNQDDNPDWQLLAQVGRYENDQFNENIYKYKLPNTFEFVTKEEITNS